MSDLWTKVVELEERREEFYERGRNRGGPPGPGEEGRRREYLQGLTLEIIEAKLDHIEHRLEMVLDIVEEIDV